MAQIIREIKSLTESPVGLIIVSLFAGIVLSVIVTLYQRSVSGAVIRALIRDNADSPLHGKTLRELGLWQNIFVRIALHGKNGVLRRMIAVSEEVSLYTDVINSGINHANEADLSIDPMNSDNIKTSDELKLSFDIQRSGGKKLYSSAYGDSEVTRKRWKSKSATKRYAKIPLKNCHFYLPEEQHEKAESLFGGKRQNPLLVLIFLAFLVLFGIGLIKLMPYIFQL